MPSAWFSIAELLAYGASLIAGARAYCGANFGTTVVSILPWFDGAHVWVRCLS